MPARETKFYDTLGVSANASDSDIKKAFRKLAVKHHPDKGGDPETFKEISRAYEVLSDSDKRRNYDQFGENGIDGPTHDPTDIFSAFFGGGMFGGRGRQPQGPKKGQDVVHQLGVSLENLYNGKTSKFRIQRKVLCDDCDGSGTKVKGASTDCGGCRGSGVRMVTRQLGPGMIQQMQAVCPDCKGEGFCIKPKDRCPGCSGERVVSEKKELVVNIDKGMRHGQKIVFAGEADEAPGTVPGDIIFVLRQNEHDKFLRKGDDLLTSRKIPLVEALTGTSLLLEHLDGRSLHCKVMPGTIVKPDAVMTIADEGMPQHKNPFVKGNMYIKFEVEFPEALGPNAHEAILKALGPLPNLTVPMEAEEHTLTSAKIENMGANQRRGYSSAHDDDDDDDGGHGGQRVQCAQQ